MADTDRTSRLSPPEVEEEAARTLVALLAPRVDALNDAVDELHSSDVPPGSPLAGDDRASDPFQLSHAAWHGITHAVDNLRALRILTVTGEGESFDVRTHPFAAYPLLRAALENASIAAWLLAPESRDIRLTRRFRLVLTDAQHGDEVAELLGRLTTPSTRERREARVAGLIENRPGIALQDCKRGAGFRWIVPAAAEAIGTEAKTASMLWHLLSGLTHGDQWASLAWAEREKVGVSADGSVITVRMTSSVANIANMTHYVIALVEAAFSLYDRRRTPAFAS